MGLLLALSKDQDKEAIWSTENSATNAWNLNFNNGNQNNNNKSTNRNRVRPVSALRLKIIGMVTATDIFEAYFDCRQRKRGKRSSIIYEMNYEERLLALRDAINDRSYSPSQSICFVVTRPRYREVFAADFCDRIVHHYIALRLEPLFELVFNDRTFNCRKGKGQLYGIECLKRDMWDCSQGYTHDCWIAKLDLQGFFMSIDKAMLAVMLDNFIVEAYSPGSRYRQMMADEKYLDYRCFPGEVRRMMLEYRYDGSDIEDLRFVTRTVILHRPELNCLMRSPREMWTHLTANKSLFTNGEGKGIAIGNLFSQLFANFLLNKLDWALEEYGIKYHGRYVDDFYMIHEDKDLLLQTIPKIREVLASVGLTLHPRKFYLQHYAKGVSFTGCIVKPGRVYVEGRVHTSFKGAVRRINNVKTLADLRQSVDSINSYLGLTRHCNEYGSRRKLLQQLARHVFKRCYINGHFEVLKLKNRYKSKNIIIEKIRNGTLRPAVFR